MSLHLLVSMYDTDAKWQVSQKEQHGLSFETHEIKKSAISMPLSLESKSRLSQS